ncbi:hypothetical protein HMPREF0322_02321 [Desulfitobacterium hafniense DP7]|uniref:Uncharacterized protein n=1 Tax=Desulfitobacterium hafniense DP7 TaxID=537010 RepID=G9XMY2_DESHA|nr:hypothetical protein HMPREF0322_02321 [Desulfitobacterium hafniense DP7]
MRATSFSPPTPQDVCIAAARTFYRRKKRGYSLSFSMSCLCSSL